MLGMEKSGAFCPAFYSQNSPLGVTGLEFFKHENPSIRISNPDRRIFEAFLMADFPENNKHEIPWYCSIVARILKREKQRKASKKL